MAKVNERKNKMMSAKKVGVLTIKTDEQCSKLVHPGKTALTGEALLVDRGIEQAFAPPFGLFAVALVLANVGDDPVIETDFAGFERVKSAVGVEIRSGNRQAQALHSLESSLKVRFEVERIMMVARHDPGRSQHIPLSVCNRQDIRGFGSFAMLISNTLAPFLRQSMAAIQVQLGQIEVITDRLDTLLPDPLQTAIGAPFLKVIVDRLPANLFFSPSFREGAIGNCVH